METFPKQQILQEYLPKAALQPMTPEAESGVPKAMLWEGLVLIHRFPFRVGRESRVMRRGNRVHRIERPKQDDSAPNNDLYLIDFGELLNISREHFQIESREDGFYLVDRGSACGTKVENENIGGRDAGGARRLEDGAIIVAGAKGSPYAFRFISFENCQVVCSMQTTE